MTTVGQQLLEPVAEPAGFHPHPHCFAAQSLVEQPRALGMIEPQTLFLLPCLVPDRNLLKARMKITTYNQHRVGSFARALVCFIAHQCNRSDRANVVMKSSEDAPFNQRARCWRVGWRVRVEGPASFLW